MNSSAKTVDEIVETKRMVDQVPSATYSIKSTNLFVILKQCLGARDDEKMLDLFQRLSKYESFPSQTPHRVKKAPLAEPSVKRRVKALFYSQDSKGEKKFFYSKVRIDTSTIPGAGLGVFAEENIPAGSKVLYVGKPVTGDYIETYSYEVLEYDEETGAVESPEPSDSSSDAGSETNSDEESSSSASSSEKKSNVLFFIDASNEKTSNWTRSINCKSKEGENNFSASQFMDQIVLKAERDIKEGEELFLFYGEEYVSCHLT